MSDVHEVVATVEASEVFGAFKAEHPEYVLAHVFCNVKADRTQTEIGYYSGKEDRIASLSVDPLVLRPPEEVFKESGKLAALDLDAVSVGLAEVRALAAKHREEKYPAHPVLQEICILQQQEGPVWNLTLVTQTLQMLILRFDAAGGSLLDEDMRNIMELRKQ